MADKSAASKTVFFFFHFYIFVCFFIEKAHPFPPILADNTFLTAKAYRLPTPPTAEALQTSICAASNDELGYFVVEVGRVCVCMCIYELFFVCKKFN